MLRHSAVGFVRSRMLKSYFKWNTKTTITPSDCAVEIRYIKANSLNHRKHVALPPVCKPPCSVTRTFHRKTSHHHRRRRRHICCSGLWFVNWDLKEGFRARMLYIEHHAGSFKTNKVKREIQMRPRTQHNKDLIKTFTSTFLIVT